MTIKILPEEKEILKKLCAVYSVEAYFHEHELKSEATGMKLDYINVTINGFISPEHVWMMCRAFSLESEMQDSIKSMKR